MAIFLIILCVGLLIWWVLKDNPGSRGGVGAASDSDTARQQRFQQNSLAAQRRYVASQNARNSHEKTTSEKDSDRYLSTPIRRSDDAGSGDDEPQKERIRRYIAAQKRYVEAENSRQQNAPEMPLEFPKFTPIITVTSSAPEQDEQPIDKDAWEGNYLDDYAAGAKERRLNGINLHIHFVDREGKATERDITTQRYAHNPDTHGGVIYAFCHLRKGNRPFAFSRIKQAVDLETGEIIPDLGAFLDAAYVATPVGVVDKFLEEHAEGIFVLFSFAKADGTMLAKERVVMLDWARAHGLTDETALAALEDQMKKIWYTTDHAFWNAVKAVKLEARDESYMQSLWSAIQAILNTDKKLSEQEAQYLKYAARQWNLPMPDLIATEPTRSKT
jgi:hypothetical protein